MEDAMEIEQTYEQRALVNSKKHRRVAYRLTKKKGQQEQSTLMQLPNEVFEAIVHRLRRPDDALRLMASCRLAYNRLRRDGRFWGRFYPKLYFVKEPALGAPHQVHHITCKPMLAWFRSMAGGNGLDIREGHEAEAINDVWSRAPGVWYNTCHLASWGTQVVTVCNDPKHYVRSVRTPKTDLPADPFDSVCKALSKKNMQAYVKESTRNHDAKIGYHEASKRDLERRLELLKNQWVDAAHEVMKERQRKETFEEKKEKSLPFIDLSEFE
jgi:hypothetical protein